MSIKKVVKAAANNLDILSCVFPASGSGTSISYDWSCGFDSDGVTRNNSGSYTVSLADGADAYLSGAVQCTLQLPDGTVDDQHNYRVFLDNVYLKDSGSFDINVTSGSAPPERFDAAGCKLHVTVVATRSGYIKNWG